MKWNEAKGISVHYKHGQQRQCEEHGFFGQIYIGRREKEFQSYNCKDFTSSGSKVIMHSRNLPHKNGQSCSLAEFWERNLLCEITTFAHFS